MAKKSKTKKIDRPKPDSIRLPDDLKEKIKVESAKENRTFSNMVITIIKKYFS